MLVVFDFAGFFVDLLVKCPVFLSKPTDFSLLLDNGLSVLFGSFLGFLKVELCSGYFGLLCLSPLEPFFALFEFKGPELIVL